MGEGLLPRGIVGAPDEPRRVQSLDPRLAQLATLVVLTLLRLPLAQAIAVVVDIRHRDHALPSEIGRPREEARVPNVPLGLRRVTPYVVPLLHGRDTEAAPEGAPEAGCERRRRRHAGAAERQCRVGGTVVRTAACPNSNSADGADCASRAVAAERANPTYSTYLPFKNWMGGNPSRTACRRRA